MTRVVRGQRADIHVCADDLARAAEALGAGEGRSWAIFTGSCLSCSLVDVASGLDVFALYEPAEAPADIVASLLPAQGLVAS